MEKKSTAKNLLKNTALMGAVSLLLRAIAVSFNSAVTARVGAEGMGLYSLVLGIYGFAVTFATSGIGLGVTRTVSEAMGRGDAGCICAEMRRGFLYAALFGTAALLLCWFGAVPLSRILGDARTVRPIRALSLSLPAVALSAAIHGYFSAVRTVAKSAAVSLCESLMRVLFCAVLLSVFADRGLESACLALTVGGAAAEVGSVLLAALGYLADRRRRGKSIPCPGGMRRLCGITLPVAFSTYIRSALVTVEHLLLPRSLILSGLARDGALAAVGVVQGMALPVVLFPAALSGSFASVLLPEVSERLAAGDGDGVRRLSERAIYAILCYSVPVAAVLSCEAYRIADLLFSSAEAGRAIRLLSVILPVMFLDTVADGILKGGGEQLFAMAVNIGDAALSLLFVLLVVPKMGIDGYLLLIAVTEILNAALSLGRALRVTGARPRPLFAVLPPFLAAALACGVVSLFERRLLLLSDGAALFLRLAAELSLSLLFLLFFSRLFSRLFRKSPKPLVTLP